MGDELIKRKEREKEEDGHAPLTEPLCLAFVVCSISEGGAKRVLALHGFAWRHDEREDDDHRAARKQCKLIRLMVRPINLYNWRIAWAPILVRFKLEEAFCKGATGLRWNSNPYAHATCCD